jgi:pimeloyl-ACP methyl ester carboxylesterase
LLVRVFDHDFPNEAAGFVLVDASHPEQERRFPSAALGGEPPSRTWERFRVATGIERLHHRAPRNAAEAHGMTSLAAIIAEEAAFATIAEQAALVQTVGDRPMVVLTAGADSLPPDVPEETRSAFREVKFTLQRELVELSTNSDHRVLPDARHYIQFDEPAAVVQAVHDVVEAVRTNGRVQGIAPRTTSGAR